MKFYDNQDSGVNRDHTVRITFQTQDYIGHISEVVGGNCKGFSLLECFPSCHSQEDIECYVENDCEFKVHEDDNEYSMRLRNEKGDTLVIDGIYDNDIEDYIVCIEITDCVIKE